MIQKFLPECCLFTLKCLHFHIGHVANGIKKPAHKVVVIPLQLIPLNQKLTKYLRILFRNIIVKINDVKELVEKWGRNNRLYRLMHTMLRRRVVFLHQVHHPALNGLHKGIETPFGDEIHLVTLQRVLHNRYQLDQILVLYPLKVLQRYLHHLQPVILSEILLQIHTHPLMNGEQQVSHHHVVKLAVSDIR